MDDLPDYDLQRTPDEATAAPARLPASSAGVWVAATLLIAAAGVAMYVAFGWRPAQAPPAVATPAPRATETLPPLGGTAEAVTIPPLDASDTVVRSLVQALSDSPAVVA